MKHEDLVVKSGEPRVEVARFANFPEPETDEELAQLITDATAGVDNGWPACGKNETVQDVIRGLSYRQASTDKANALRLKSKITDPVEMARQTVRKFTGKKKKVSKVDAIAALQALLAQAMAASDDGEEAGAAE